MEKLDKDVEEEEGIRNRKEGRRGSCNFFERRRDKGSSTCRNSVHEPPKYLLCHKMFVHFILMVL